MFRLSTYLISQTNFLIEKQFDGWLFLKPILEMSGIYIPCVSYHPWLHQSQMLELEYYELICISWCQLKKLISAANTISITQAGYSVLSFDDYMSAQEASVTILIL